MKVKFIAMIWAVMFAAPITFAQNSISGTVYSAEDGEPLIGAKLMILHGYSGTYSDRDGKFKISGLKDYDYQLHVTYMGYEKQVVEFKIDGKDVEFDFHLEKAIYVTGEVIVTATRAGEKTPTTYTNIDRRQIEKSNYGQDIPYLFRFTPSTVVTSDAGAGIGYSGIRIRGVDPTRTNVTINGIPINDSESHGVYWVNVPDFSSSSDNIQIQRGVGTSSNGAAAFGASINIQTNDVNRKAYGVLDNSIGSFNTMKNTVRIGSGLINDKFTFDMRLSNIQSGGYIDRASSNLRSLYTSVAWVGKNAMLKANIFMGREKTYQAWYGTPQSVMNGNTDSIAAYADRNWIFGDDRDNLEQSGRTYNFYTYDNEVDNYGQDHYQLHFIQSITPKIHLSLAGHYTRGKGYFEQYRVGDDFSIYGFDTLFLTADTISTTDLIRRRWLDNHFSGAVFALNYKSTKGLNLTFGGAGNAYTGKHYGEVIWAEYSSNSDIREKYYETEAFKIDVMSYLKATYSIKKMTFYGDLQYRYIDYQFEGFDDVNGAIEAVDQQVNFSFFNPKVGFMYDLSDRHNFYASFAIGNREPTRGDFVESTPASRPRSEQLQNLEVGYRMKTKSLFVNANYYHMNYKDQLILTGEINDVGAYTRTNVAKSFRSGVELEAGAYLGKKISVTGNVTYSVNKISAFTQYIDDYDNGGQKEFQHTNSDIAFSPNIIGSLGISYEPVKDLYVTLLGKYVGAQYLDNTSNANRKIDGYFISNMKVDYTIRDLFVKEIILGVSVNNLFNQFYANNGYTWGYYAGGTYTHENFYFPQAGINWLAKVTLKL